MLRAHCPESSYRFLCQDASCKQEGPKAHEGCRWCEKKITKEAKPLTAGNLQSAIALRQYTDTIKRINAYLEKQRDIAPRVLHMLESGMLLEEQNRDMGEKLPASVNKFRLLSLDNFKMIAKHLFDKRMIPERHYNNFLLIKTKMEAVQIICFWLSVLDTSALPSKHIPTLLKFASDQAAANGAEIIAATTFVNNSKQGRNAGMIANVNAH